MSKESKAYKNLPKKVYIRTFGCQMNDRDSELVSGLLLKKGYKLAKSEYEADVILFNGCSVRQHAEDKVWSEIGKLKKWKYIAPPKFAKANLSRGDTRPTKIVGLVGCMAQNYQQSAFQKCALLDLVVGPNNIDAIPELISIVSKDPQAIGLAVGKRERDAFVYNTEYIQEISHCNVNISEGCNNLCSYCIVPYVRGMERSRAPESIIKEIEELVKKGVKSITLLGQNVNSYRSSRLPVASFHKDKVDGEVINFVDLLRMVNDIEGLVSFDFVTSHPKDASIELFKVMAGLEKLKKFLHLPVQSGSDRILKLMNRGYTRANYLELAKQARKIIPNLRLTTDVMVGFPTEREEDFEDTFSLMKEVKFGAAYIFKYSPRPHTQASEMPDDVPKEIKKKRNQILLEFQKNLHKQRKGNLMNNFIKAVIVIITLSLLTANICLADINNKVFDDVLALILKGKYNEALDECNRLERKIDKRLKTELYYLQGTCLLQQEEFELAQDAFKKALPYAKGELSLEIYMGIADSYFQQYNFKQAISIYEQLLSKREDNKNYLAMLYYKLGKAYQKGSLWVKSDFYFKQLKSKFPQSFEAELLKDTDTGGNFFTVQVGCFTSEKNAKKLFSSLTEKGYEAYITELKSNSQALYRVRVGKFTSRLAAEFAERDLKTKEHLPTHIFP